MRCAPIIVIATCCLLGDHASTYQVIARTKSLQGRSPGETEYAGSIQIVTAEGIYADLGGEIVIDLLFGARKGIRFPAVIEGRSWSSDFEMESAPDRIRVVGRGGITREFISGVWSVTVITESESRLLLQGTFSGKAAP